MVSACVAENDFPLRHRALLDEMHGDEIRALGFEQV